MNIFESIEALQAVGIRDWLTMVADIISVSGKPEQLYGFSNKDLDKLAHALQASLEKIDLTVYSVKNEISVYGKTIHDASGLIHHTDAHICIAPLTGYICLKVVSYHHVPGKEAVVQKPFIVFFDESRTLSTVSRGGGL